MKCINCGQNKTDMYAVKDELWEEYGEKKEHLCVFCFENRLGRELEIRDLQRSSSLNFWLMDVIQKTKDTREKRARVEIDMEILDVELLISHHKRQYRNLDKIKEAHLKMAESLKDYLSGLKGIHTIGMGLQEEMLKKDLQKGAEI